MPKINLVELKGSHYAIGYQHGQRYAEIIRMFAAQRIHLCTNLEGRDATRRQVLDLAAACWEEHLTYDPDLAEELRGMADATGLSLPELVIVNGYTDFVDTIYGEVDGDPVGATTFEEDCTAFIVANHRSADQYGYFGQTWDMNAEAMPYVILLHGQPDNAPDFLAFTVTGCVGMIGMNEAGIAFGINNLSGGDGRVGVTWPFVVRRMLAQTTIDAALECLTSAKLAGAHNYLLFDKHGHGYNVEAMSTHYEIQELAGDALAHTNHCLISTNRALERERPETSTSQIRLEQAESWLAEQPITAESLMALTRQDYVCTVPKTPDGVATCGAAIMQPATGQFWALWGLPNEGDYQRFTI